MPDSLKRQIHLGLEALRDPEMERRVHEHLDLLGESPRNIVHAAMIAGRFRREATGTCVGVEHQATPAARLNSTGETEALRDVLGAGCKAMEDPGIEAAVEAYFANNPGYSRDPIHVAAIASQLAARQGQPVPDRSAGLQP